MKKIKNYFQKIRKNPIPYLIVIWYGFMWSWMLFTDTLDLAGDSTQGMIIAIIVLTVNVSLSSWITWKAFKVADWLLKHFSKKGILLVIPIFALADWLVAWVPSIIWIGPQGRVDSILPLASPTIAAINTPLAFSARILGFFGLGGFIWAIIYLAIRKKYRRYSLIVAAVLAVLSLFGWLIYKTPNGSEFNATIISEALDDRVQDVSSDSTDLIVFPEYGLDVLEEEKPEDRVSKTSNEEKKVYFLGSQQIYPNDEQVGHYNRLLYGNSADGITAKQDKYRLIPGGEDLAYIVRVALRATNQVDTLNYFSFAKGVIMGEHQLQPYKISNDTVVGVAVCSSIIAPQDYHDFANAGATVFSNSASLTIFKGSPLFAWQQKSMAKFMAVANSRYFMQSANAARAYVLDNNGQTLKEVTGIESAEVNIKNNSTKTVYTLIGEWVVAIGALSASILLMRHAYTRKSHSKKKK